MQIQFFWGNFTFLYRIERSSNLETARKKKTTRKEGNTTGKQWGQKWKIKFRELKNEHILMYYQNRT